MDELLASTQDKADTMVAIAIQTTDSKPLELLSVSCASVT